MPAAPLLPPVADLAAYRALRRDPAVWLPAVETICARHGLGSDAYAATTGTNVVFHVPGRGWIKLFTPLWPEDFVRERTGLAAVAALDGLGVPEVLHEGELEGWPYVVLSPIPGQAIGTIWQDMSEATRVDLARQLGALLARMHAVDTSACGAIRCDWRAFAGDLRATTMTRQAGHGLQASWLVELEAHLAALPPLDEERPVLLHADVTDEHVFVEQIDGHARITGLIDFGDAMIGDYRYEFAAPLVFLTQGRPRQQRALLEGYGLAEQARDPTFTRGLVGWTLMHRYGRIPTYAEFTPGRPPDSLARLVESLWTASAGGGQTAAHAPG
ncbi:MAG: aminoglycoside 3'-phosphotransferase/choline kinase family protein [Planctomycetota bacterium]|nr:aminoglycoside 3'-phosphotransferase/choline kinase family protein [Planctomycetota bacterium]